MLADLKRIEKVIQMLRDATNKMAEPASVEIVSEFGRDPYLILISCLLSLRTKDTVSLPASKRLFLCAKTPQNMRAVDIGVIQKAIFPVGFYRRKAATIHDVSKQLIDRFAGKVPQTLPELLSLPGVGLKTANLVLAQGFQIPAICVDVHVHRISNRLGIVATSTPEQTEVALRAVVPPEYWIEYSNLLVKWGQNVCVPVSPRCSSCPLFPLCPRVGVAKSR